MLIVGVISSIHDARCVLCSSDEENLFHLFFPCPVASSVCRKFGAWLGCNLHSYANQCAPFLFLYGKLRLAFGKERAKMFQITTCQIIWLGRNNSLFNNISFSVDEAFLSIRFISWNWLTVGSFTSKPCSQYD